MTARRRWHWSRSLPSLRWLRSARSSGDGGAVAVVPLGGGIVCDSDVEIWVGESVLSQRYWGCGVVRSVHLGQEINVEVG